MIPWFSRSNPSCLTFLVLVCMAKMKSKQVLERDAFTMQEVAQKLEISYITVFRLVKRGLLKPCVALRIKLISQREIDRFLREGQAV